LVKLPPLPPATKTEHATEVLRRRIRAGEFEPGQPLRIDVLTRELNMSSTPVREALRLLQADRLVEYHPHKGTVVAGGNAGDPPLEEVYRLRMLLEPYATELAVERMTAQQLAQLEQTHQSLLKAFSATRMSRRRIADHNVNWHWIIYGAAGMPMLSELIQRLWDAFPWRTLWAVPHGAESSTEEHEAIMGAIRARDAAAAAALMREHIGHGFTTVTAEREP
jgi:DNA-binding GntR family transcriptional regulator